MDGDESSMKGTAEKQWDISECKDGEALQHLCACEFVCACLCVYVCLYLRANVDEGVRGE